MNILSAIIGGGLVGLATAREFSSKMSTILLESEDSILSGTSSRNSEVVHSGIYYKKTL